MGLDQCILCKQPLGENTSPEHVIPQYLGGRLKLRLLCDGCNHGVGADLYSDFKQDVYIRRAGTIFKDELPKIHENIENTQKYTTTSPTGTKLEAKRSNTGIHITLGPQSDGSIVLPTENAVQLLTRQLIDEEKMDQDQAQAVAVGIWNIPNKELRRISSRHTIVRWDVDSFNKDFSKNSIVNDRAPILMAFEYLTLLVGKAIYHQWFDPIRSYILTDVATDRVSLGNFISDKPQAFHLIYPEFFSDRTLIHLHLFGYAIYSVEFKRVPISNCPDFCYLEDLVGKVSFGAMSVAEGKSSQWREFSI